MLEEELKEREIGWEESQQIIDERMNKEVRRDFFVKKGDEKLKMSYYVRALTPDERDAVDALAAKEYKDVVKDELRQGARGGKRNVHDRRRKDLRETPSTDEEKRALSSVKEEHIWFGLVKGPDGFVKTKENVRKLPAVIKTDLADTIDKLSELGVDDEADFRPVW